MSVFAYLLPVELLILERRRRLRVAGFIGEVRQLKAILAAGCSPNERRPNQ